jgi:ankyrin repeat protein
MTGSFKGGARFESLRKEAKRLLRDLRAGAAEATARFPALGSGATLREVQRALARERGFATWAALKDDCEARALAEESEGDLVDELLRCACLSYGTDDSPDTWRRAERIRARRPSIARVNIFTACVTGELPTVTRLLAKDPSLASTPGGPQGWRPLLFVCYGRMPHPPAAEHAVEIARLLLDHGADPDSSFRWEGTLRFTALTGAIGRGELGQPTHPRGRELAELLLERGANPNDSQALYNDMLEGDDDGWLRLLLAHGLTAADPANWEAGATTVRILDFLLAHAARQDHRRRAQCLLEHGADPNVPDLYNRKSPYENALLAGNLELAETLLRHGATRRELAGRDAFLAACSRLDRAAARALLDGHPEYLASSDPLIEAAEQGRDAAARLLVELGMDADRAGAHDKRALHVAAGRGARPLVELLLEHGADPMARVYGGTACGWARHGGHPELARWLAERTRSPHDAAMTGHVQLLEELLAADPAAANRPDDRGDTPLHRLPDDPERGPAIVELLLRHGADPAAPNRDGKTAAQVAESRGLDDLADLF